MKYFFGAGTPRSGSTLACNILNQREDFYASPTSGVHSVVKPILTGWDKIPEFNANANDAHKRDMLNGVFDGYYKQHAKPFVLDKCRAWPAEIESLEFIFGTAPKIVVFVRDVRDILCSWEKMYRRDKKAGRSTPGESVNAQAFVSMDKRMEFWSDANSPLGSAFNVILDAITRGLKAHLYFFDFDKWSQSPDEEFSKLYEWLEIPDFKHDFKNIKQVLFEKDEYYGYTELHNIREGALIPSQPQWPNFMSKEAAARYESSNFWRTTKPT